MRGFRFFAKCFVRRKGLFEDCNQWSRLSEENINDCKYLVLIGRVHISKDAESDTVKGFKEKQWREDHKAQL